MADDVPASMTDARPIEVLAFGAGTPVVFLHGCVLDGPTTWSAQRGLADSGRWEIRVLQRRGFGAAPMSHGDDCYADRDDLVNVLSQPVHLVGHSYGGLGVMLLAASRPDLVLSLTVLEPPAYSAAIESPLVQDAVTRFDDWWDHHAPVDPRSFLVGWADQFGIKVRVPDVLQPQLVERVRLLRNCRRPWTADMPIDALAATTMPKLVVSGGHSDLLELICDQLAARIGADRTVVSGAGHAIPAVGQPCNEVLERFWAHGRPD